jgi:large subunit ribosomal protein L9
MLTAKEKGKKMQIILLERVDRLGQMGDVVTVKPGYARNFLLPKKKALRATRENVSLFEKQKLQLEANNIKRRDDAHGVAGKMVGVQVTIIRPASEVGQLYGAVRSQDITDALINAGYTVSRNQVSIVSPIKNLGEHTVKIILHPEVSVDVSVLVAQSAEEAEVFLLNQAEARQKQESL